MKTISKILLISLLFVFLCIVNSCKKDEISQEEMANLILDESENALTYLDDADQNYDLVNALTLKSCPPTTCPTATFTFDQTTCSYNFALDFGTEGCQGRNGWIRKGKITVSITGCRNVLCTVTFDKYYVNGYLIQGTKTITLVTPSNTQSPSIKIKISGSVKDPNGKVTTIDAETNREWVAGYATPDDFDDDIFSTTGYVNGVCSEGVNFSMNITSPLIKARSCKWIQKGTVNIAYGDKTIIKDYGNGTCDSLATVNINGEVKEIVLTHDCKKN